MTGISAAEQALTFAGTPFVDEKPLSEYDMEQEATIKMDRVPLGGADPYQFSDLSKS